VPEVVLAVAVAVAEPLFAVAVIALAF